MGRIELLRKNGQGVRDESADALLACGGNEESAVSVLEAVGSSNDSMEIERHRERGKTGEDAGDVEGEG